jgi:hypothetical protein
MSAFFFGPLDPRPLAMFRIFLGAEILAHYLFLLPHWSRFYARDGMLSLDVPTWTAAGPPPEDWWSVFRLGDGVVPLHLWWLVGAAAALALLLGYRSRWAALVLWVMTSSLIHRNPAVVNGEEVVFRMYTLWAMFAPLGAVWALDAHTATGREAPRTTDGTWAVRCLQINFVLIYLISLPNKLVDDPAWLAGDAIYLALASDLWGRGIWPQAGYVLDGWLGALATWGTIAVEALAPWMLWWRRTAPVAVAMLAALHLGIAVALNGVAFFSLSMVVGCWLFAPPAWAAWTWARIAGMRPALREM